MFLWHSNVPKIKCLYKRCIIRSLFICQYRCQHCTYNHLVSSDTYLKQTTPLLFFLAPVLCRKWIEIHVYTHIYRYLHMYLHDTQHVLTLEVETLHMSHINDSLSNKIPLTLSEYKEHEAVKGGGKTQRTWKKAKNNRG